MKKIKKMVVSLLGGGATAGAVALVLMSAGLKKEETNKVADLHWFEVTPSGNFGSAIPTGEDGLPQLECTSTIPTTLCAVGLTDEQVDGMGNPDISSPNDADNSNKRYKDEQ